MILIILECASAIQKLTLLEYPEAHTTGIQKKKNGSALSNNESNPFSSMFFFSCILMIYVIISVDFHAQTTIKDKR